MDMKIGVKEFRANLPAYLESETPFAITRHGETIGYFIPTRQRRHVEDVELLNQAAAQIAAMIASAGLTENDIAADYKEIRDADHDA